MNNTRYKVVLVDDNIATLNQGKSLLRAFYKVYTVQSAAILFENLEKDIPDLILLDVEMPGMDGFETIKILKADPRYKNIPVMFLTSKSDEESERVGFSLGAVDYITKPFSAPLLQKRISNHILFRHVQAAVSMYSDNLENMIDEVSKANERTRILLDKTPLSVMLWNSNLELIDCNEATVKLFGFRDKQECIDRYLELYPECQPDGERSIERAKYFVEKAFGEGGCEFEWTYKMLDGTLMPAEVVLIRVDFEDGHAVAGYTRDLREQKAVIEEMRRAEIAEESNKAKSRFLATMSHEIRTPMNSIMGFAELALDSHEDDNAHKVKEFLERIIDSTKWLLHVINDILDISKIESGKVELENVPFDLQDIFYRCQSVILPEIVEKGLELEINLEPLVGKKIIGDPFKLYQALMNLLSNAAKFTNSGMIVFSSIVKGVDARPDAGGASQPNGGCYATIYFEVRDSGIGMSQEQREKIFDPFTQADSSTTRTHGGTGLGLSITRNIVELMGGELHVESLPGVGSTFSFELTFETVEEPEYALDEELNGQEKPRFEGLVLVCDDNPLNQEVICEHLARVGLRAVVAANGRLGFEIVQERCQQKLKPFDLIFMDMFMPQMDGLEATKRIIELNTGTPIVAMTASIMAGDLEIYSNHGLSACLGKPFTASELWAILRSYLSPVKSNAGCEDKPLLDDDDLIHKLKQKFILNNQTVFAEITGAMAIGDMELAHRMVHTLKGSAGFIGKQRLHNAADEVARAFRNEDFPISEESLSRLKAELDLVIEELKPMLDEVEAQEVSEPLSDERVAALFEQLAIMLDNRNAACMDLLPEIRAVPGAEKLAKQIENYDFKIAAQTLAELSINPRG